MFWKMLEITFCLEYDWNMLGIAWNMLGIRNVLPLPRGVEEGGGTALTTHKKDNTVRPRGPHLLMAREGGAF